jgi:hypothetical protein
VLFHSQLVWHFLLLLTLIFAYGADPPMPVANAAGCIDDGLLPPLFGASRHPDMKCVCAHCRHLARSR